MNWFNGIIAIDNYGIGYEMGDISLQKFIDELRQKLYQFSNNDIALFLKHITNLVYYFYKQGYYYTDLKLENIVLNVLIN